MKRNTLNYLLDGILALVMLGLLATGLLMRFVLPPRSGRLQLWGWDRHDFGDLHYWLVILLLAALLAHLALHWQWICLTTAKLLRPGRNSTPIKPLSRNLIGAGVLTAMIALSFGFVHLANKQVTNPRPTNDPSIQSSQPETGHPNRPRHGQRRNAPAKSPDLNPSGTIR